MSVQHRTSQSQLKRYKTLIDKEGINIDDAINIFKPNPATLRPFGGNTIMKGEAFKYVGDIQRDYNVRSKLSKSIIDPDAPPDEYKKLFDLQPAQLWKPGPFELNARGIASQYQRTQISSTGKGRILPRDADPGPGPSGGLLEPVVEVELPAMAHDVVALRQAAYVNHAQSIRGLRNPRIVSIRNRRRAIASSPGELVGHENENPDRDHVDSIPPFGLAKDEHIFGHARKKGKFNKRK